MSSLYVTESGSCLYKKGGHVVVGRNSEVLAELPLESIEDVTVVDTVQISSALIASFLERQVPVNFLTTGGKYRGTLVNYAGVDVIKHNWQFELLKEGAFYLTLARKVIEAKAQNQIVILRRYNRSLGIAKVAEIINQMQLNQSHLTRCTDYHAVMGLEGIISRYYFAALALLVPEKFTFSGRSKRLPLDPFNALLSLGYSMLFNEVLAAIVACGLHPYVGFLHQIAAGHPALASDLMEEWRAVLIDSMVLSLLSRHMLTIAMFDLTPEQCLLSSEGRKVFLTAYNKKLRSVNRYQEGSKTYREGIHSQVKAYASAIMNYEAERYVPLMFR